MLMKMLFKSDIFTDWPHMLKNNRIFKATVLHFFLHHEAIFKVPLLRVMKGSYFGFGIPNNSLTCMQGQKTLSFSYNMHLFFAQRLPNDSLNDSFFQTPPLRDATLL